MSSSPSPTVPKTTSPERARDDGTGFSWSRVLAVLLKEFIQLRRDRHDLRHAHRRAASCSSCCSATRSTPIRSHLPDGCGCAWTNGPLVRSVVQAAAEYTGYFSVVTDEVSPTSRGRSVCWQAAQGAVRLGVPCGFHAHRLLRGESPGARGATPMRPIRRPGGPAMAALAAAAGASRCKRELSGKASLAHLRGRCPHPSTLIACTSRYNPEGISAYNVVPGLLGVILTMTLVMMTSMAMTRERGARHAGEPAGHARAAAGDDGGKDPALRDHRLRAGGDRAHGCLALLCSRCPWLGSLLDLLMADGAAVHRRDTDRGLHLQLPSPDRRCSPCR